MADEISASSRGVSADVRLGNNVKIFGNVNLYGCDIGDNTKIGSFVEIQRGSKIGANCKISSHSFIFEGVAIEDDVFVGHHVVFINDRYPRATNGNGQLKTDADWQLEPTVVRRGASLGSGAVIMCGIVVGEDSIIGAGSVVIHDVPPHSVVCGNPARVIRDLAVRDTASNMENV